MRKSNSLISETSPQAVLLQRALESEAYIVARAKALRLALAEIGPSTVTVARMRELGGYSAVAQRALETVAPAAHDEPLYGDEEGWLRRALLFQVASMRAELQNKVVDGNRKHEVKKCVG